MSLSSVVITEQLAARPARPANHAAENRAMLAMASVLAERGPNTLQRLTEIVLELCGAHSAGISIVETDGEEHIFRWRAVAGAYAKYLGGTMPRHSSPCGAVLEANATVLMSNLTRHFDSAASLHPGVSEVLLVPLVIADETVGTVWIVSHTLDKVFDAEDARILNALTGFVSLGIRTLSDIAEAESIESRRARAESALATLSSTSERERRKFETAVTNAADFVYLFDLTGRFTYVNKALLDFWGKELSEAVGSNFFDLEYPSELAAKLQRQIRQVIRTKLPLRDETPYATPSGIRAHDYIFVPVLGSDGEVEAVAGSTRDVTESREASVKLRESEERFRFLDLLSQATRSEMDPTSIMATTARLVGEQLLVSRVAYADVDADGDGFTIRHDWAAPGISSTVGTYRLDDFGSRAVQDLRNSRTLLIRDVDSELTPEEGAATFNAIGVKAIVCCPLVKEGRLAAMMAVHDTLPRNWTAAEIALLEEVVERSWAHIERVRDAAAVRTASRQKDEFLATLAHELRNPLAPIRNGLTALRLGGATGMSQNLVAMMERQLGHLVHLVDDLLDVSRVTTGKIALRSERTQINEIIAAAVETSLPGIQAARHSLESRVGTEELELVGDPTRLAQVLTNLLNNASKYTPEGGRIILTAERDGEMAVIRVMDSGVGIPREMLPKVFDIFTQVDCSLDRSQGGLGLGLALVRRLVEMHGGSVYAESAGLGEGSTFVVRLPILSGINEIPA